MTKAEPKLTALTRSIYPRDLILDSETTGIPDKKAHWEIDYKLFPYVLSVAWRFNNQLHYYFIYQEGRKVPPNATAANGITTEMANNREVAKDASWVFSKLIEDTLAANNIVGHNIYFDTSIIKANIIRTFGPKSKEIEAINEGTHKDKRIDTMRSSLKLMGGKWPKLIDLHSYLFPDIQFNAHDAMEDVLATERCYNELRRRKII